MEYKIHKDGKIDICGNGMKLEGLFPYKSGTPILPCSLETTPYSVRYVTTDGSVLLSLRNIAQGIVLSTEIRRRKRFLRKV